MRLALVRQHYRPDGRSERAVERALEALLERNVAISLVTRSWPPTRLQLIEPAICDPFHAGALWRDWGFAVAACRVIRRIGPTLVESHERLLCCDVYCAGEGVHAAWIDERLRRAGAAARMSIKLSPRERYLLRAERRMYASPWLRAVICHSKMVRDEIRSRFGLPEARLPVIYHPVDSDRFHPGLRAHRAATLARHGIDAEATVYLAVSSDFARDGIDTAIDALAALRTPARLIVVGDDPQPDRYRDAARARGVADRVTLAGAVADTRPYYGAADAFVLPSLYDPSPAVVQEAMACGLAVVTSTKSGAAELLREHDAGLVVASGDVAGLAAHLDALQDAATRARFAANARRAVLPLSPAAITLQRVLLYRELLTSAVAKGTGAMDAAGDSLQPSSLMRSAGTGQVVAGGVRSAPDTGGKIARDA